MKLVIAGCGKIGELIISYLSKENHSITVIDKDKNVINNIVNMYDVGGVVGNATYVEILKDANVQKCDIFMAVGGNDEDNFISAKLAKTLGARTTIARVRDTDYTEQAEIMKETFGLDMLINPELAVAEELFYRLKYPFSSTVFPFENGKVVSIEVKVPEDSGVANKSIVELVGGFESRIIVGAILRDGAIQKDGLLEIPNGESIIHGNDLVNIISTPEVLDMATKKLGVANKKIRSVCIIGGSRVAHHLSKMLTNIHIGVKIIEADEERCRKLIAKLNSRVEIVYADGTNEQVLSEERIGSYDACITLTGHDEENIIVSLFAKEKGVGTVITKVNNDRLDVVLDKLELDSKISSKNVTVSQVLHFIRSFRSKQENTMEQLKKSMNNKLEILEFNIGEDKDFVGKSIKFLKIKSGILIGSIVRNGAVIVPSGDFIFEPYDKVIIYTKSGIRSLDRILR